MRRNERRMLAVLGLSALSLIASPAAAQQSRTTEVRSVEIVSVQGNDVVVKTDKGAEEYTVSDDFRATVDGKQLTVRELKPGMKGTVTITTTTTVHPVVITEERNGEVLKVQGNAIVIKGPAGIRMWSEVDVSKQGIRLYREGKPLNFGDIRAGDRLTATFVTTSAPRVLTEREVDTALSAAPTPAPRAGAPAATPAPARAAAAPAPATSAPARQLPKTASLMPLVGFAGVMLLATAVILWTRRRLVS